MNADGTGTTQLTDTTDNDTHPTWSPDGSTIVYVGPNVGSQSPLLAVKPDGSPVALPGLGAVGVWMVGLASPSLDAADRSGW